MNSRAIVIVCMLPGLAIVLLFTGCAVHKSAVQTSAGMVWKQDQKTREAGICASAPAFDSSIEASIQNPSPYVSSSQSAQEKSLAMRVAAQLEEKYVISETSSISLLVKKPGATATSSLFEEAIALSKLRGNLKLQPRIPSQVSTNTTLQNGKAIIPFLRSVSPSDATAAIITAFKVDGVQSIYATFKDPG